MAGIFSSVADMFRPTQQVTVAPQPVASPMAMQNPGAALVTPPAGASLPTANAAPANPMDEFTTLWQTDPNATPSVDPLTTPLFNTDPAKIAAAAGKIDFMAQMPPDLVAKAMSGTDPAAFMQLINAVAQRTLATSTQLNAATLEQATSRNNDRVMQAIPGRVKQIQLDSIQSENPVLQHPASQPFLQLVRAQIQMKNPGMSAATINAQAERTLTGFASQLAAPASTEATRSAAGGTDWDSWAAS